MLRRALRTALGRLSWPGLALRRDLEERIRDAECRLKVIVDTSPAAMITADAEGVITGWNHKAEAIFGWPAAEAIGRTIAGTIIPRRYRRAHERGLARLRETGEAKILGKAVQMMARHREGREFPVEVVVSSGVEACSRAGYVAFITDISQRREAERLRAAQFTVTRPLANSTSWAEAAPLVIRGICDTLGWARGEFWALERAGDRLRLEQGWHRPARDLD